MRREHNGVVDEDARVPSSGRQQERAPTDGRPLGTDTSLFGAPFFTASGATRRSFVSADRIAGANDGSKPRF